LFGTTKTTVAFNDCKPARRTNKAKASVRFQLLKLLKIGRKYPRSYIIEKKSEIFLAREVTLPLFQAFYI
jgi:hypothetical protein